MASSNPADQTRAEAAHSGIMIRDHSDGGKEFSLPVWRNFGEKFGFLSMWLVLAGCLWVSVFLNAQVVGRLPSILHFVVVNYTDGVILVLGIIEFLLTIFCLNLWLRSSRIIASPGQLRVITHWAFVKRSVIIPTAKIIELKAVNNASSNETLYYDIVVLSTGEKKSWLAQHTAPAAWYTENERKAFNTGGKNLTLATGLVGEADAQWLLRQLRTALKITV